MSKIEKKVTQTLAKADIQIGGNRPWDIQVKNKKFFSKIIWDGSLGLGESYVNKYFECDQVDVFCYKILKNKLQQQTYNKNNYTRILTNLFINFQSLKNAVQVAKKHYDIEVKIFKNFLDKRMIYSCGYWKNTNSLNKAQENKLDLIATKLQFQKGMRILDIGCGWGGAAKYLVTKYKVDITGITISKQQYQHAIEYNTHPQIKYILSDYRNHVDTYDAIYSIGMFEHVGHKNYTTYFQNIQKNLTDKASFLLHTIGMDITANFGSSWASKYIFPNGELPSQKLLVNALESLFMIDDWHNFGCDYDKTLMTWYKKFVHYYTSLQNKKYDDRFYRTWRYYLLSCAGAFRARYIQLWQILLTPTHSTKVPFDIPRVQ